MLRYATIPVTAFQQNCSIVWCDETMKAAVIDPGGNLDVLLTAVKRLGVTLEQIWLTHAHIDHAGGTAELSQQLDLPIIGPHPGDQFWIDGLPMQGQRFGLPHAEPFTPTRWLHDGDTVSIGHCTLNVRHCPGHTPGHVGPANTRIQINIQTVVVRAIPRKHIPTNFRSYFRASS